MSTDWAALAAVSSQKRRPCCSSTRAWEPAPPLRHGVESGEGRWGKGARGARWAGTDAWM